MKYLFLFLVSLGCIAVQLRGQDCHVALHGTIYDGETMEGLPFATITIPALAIGTVTDKHGHYTVPNLCEGVIYLVEISHLECNHQSVSVVLHENQSLDLHLSHKHSVLDNVVVVAKAVPLAGAQSSTSLSESEHQLHQHKGLAQLAEQNIGVYQVGSGQNSSKPMINGLTGSRIAVVQQGVTIEGQQWGSEHAPEVDVFSAGSVEVVRGAAGVKYGVGALGGALVLKDPAWGANTNGWAHIGYAHNGRSPWAAVQVEHVPTHARWKSRVQASVKYGGNQHAPRYYLGNTAQREQNLRFSHERSTKAGIWRLGTSVFHQKFGILSAAHAGNLTDLQNAIRADQPINNRDAFSFQIKKPLQTVTHWLAKAAFQHATKRVTYQHQLSWQYNIRQEYDAHRNGGTNNKSTPALSLYNYTTALESSAKHAAIRHWSGEVGAQATWQYNQTGTGGYVPDQMTWAGSVYAQEHWRKYPVPIEYEFGIRLDARSIHVTDTVSILRKLDTTLRYENVSLAAGMIWSPTEHSKIRLQSALAWRPPNMIELYAQGVHHGAASYERGTQGLRPEKAWNQSIDIQFTQKHVFLQVNTYANLILGYIYLQPTAQSILTIRGAYPVYLYQQTNAKLLGADVKIGLNIWKKWGLIADASTLRGSLMSRSDGQEKWLPLLPPDRLRASLVFDGASEYWHSPQKSPFGFRLGCGWVSHQSRAPERTLILAPPPSFLLWNAQFNYQVSLKNKQNCTITISSDNLLNATYRSYLNSFRFFADKPGRQISLQAKWTF
jgi:iron complex outermembrane recepter protein